MATPKVYRYSVCFGWPRYGQPRPTRQTNSQPYTPRYQSDGSDHWVGPWLDEQLWRAYLYRKQHYFIELERRQRYYEILKTHCPEVAGWQLQINELEEAIQGQIRIIKHRNKQANARRIREDQAQGGNGKFNKAITVAQEEEQQELDNLKAAQRRAFEAFDTCREAYFKTTEQPPALKALEESWKETVAEHKISPRTVGSWRGKEGAAKLAQQPPVIQRQWQQLEAARAAWRQQYPYRRDDYELSLATNERIKRLYNSSGLAWTTSGDINGDAEKLRKGPPPQKPHYDQTGYLSRQIQGGLLVTDLLQGNKPGVAQLKMVRPLESERRRQRNQAKGRPNKYLMELHIPINMPEDQGRTSAGYQKRLRGKDQPILVVPFVLHRPLPEDGRVKQIKLVRRLEGLQLVWDVQFVVTSDERKQTATQGKVGVSLCQHKVGNDLLVAFAKGDDNQYHRLVLTTWRREEAEKDQVARKGGRGGLTATTYGNTTTYTCWGLLDLWQRANDLMAMCDRSFERMCALLINHVQETWGEEPPAWLHDALYYLHPEKWRQRQMWNVLHLWREHLPDDPFLKELEAWRREDFRLFSGYRGITAKAERIRLDVYRKFATSLAQRYQLVIVPDTDYAKLAQLPEVGEKDDKAAWRTYRRQASLGMLRTCLEQRAAQIKEAHAEKLCWGCNGPLTDSEEAGLWQCQGCGQSYRQLEFLAESYLHAGGEVVKRKGRTKTQPNPKPTKGLGKKKASTPSRKL